MSTATNPAVIHIHFKNNYAEGADAYTQDFYINPKTIESGFQAYLEDGTQYSYTGSAVEPKVVVSPTTVDVEEGSLVEGEDYTLTYYNNVNAGEATVTVQGIGNYSGTVVLPFNVVASLTSANITAEDQFYTGQEIHAPLTVTCGGNTLVAGTDYKVTYNSDDNWESTGTATITPLKQYYSGEGSVTYDIIFDPDLLEVSNYNKTYTYTGSSIKPNFIVKTPSGEQLMYDSDDVTYYNSSTGAGDTTSIGTITASIPITVGSKSCTLKVKYEIVSKSIENCTIMPLNDNVYSGRALYPPVIVKDGNTYLTEGTDYTLSYSNNTNPGTGYVTITGKGDYDGEMVATFNIISPNVLGLSGSAVDDTSVKLTWLRNARITGYEIYSEDGATKYGTTSANTFTVTGLNSGQTYTFKVRTYVKVGTTTTYGAFNTVTVHTGLSKPSITGSSYARKRATINWSGTTDVTGYEIYRSTSSNGTYSKIAVMPATAGGYSDSGLNSGSTYYYKVRAYEKVGDNAFIYGYFSDSIAITVR